MSGSEGTKGIAAQTSRRNDTKRKFSGPNDIEPKRRQFHRSSNSSGDTVALPSPRSPLNNSLAPRLPGVHRIGHPTYHGQNFPPTQSRVHDPKREIPRTPTSTSLHRRILVINPTSDQRLTDTIRAGIRPPPGTMVSYYTTQDGPFTIDGAYTTSQSVQAALAPLIKHNALSGYDGFLVAWYSEHPLVESLREKTSRPVLGIFQASISWACLRNRRFGIITTASCGDTLDESVGRTIDSSSPKFRGTVSNQETGNVYGDRWITEAALKLVGDRKCRVLILGDVRILQSDQAVRSAVGKSAEVINPVRVGIHLLAGLIHCEQQTLGAEIYG
jgi:Asp/Glu/hydantoin racemase